MRNEDLVEQFREMKQRRERVTALTAYDYPTARLLDESGLDVILVGDSLGMVVLGYEDTTHVLLNEILHHTRAVARGVKRALLVADLPIHTYDTPEQALQTARQLIEAGARAVKLEGGLSHVAQIEAITSAGIPFMAHIGMLPQSVREEGGYKVKGRSREQAEALLADARAVQEAGAFSIVLEIVAPDTAKMISHAVNIPTIGIGSGNGCDGEILVTHDLIGLFPWFTPKFVAQEAHVAEQIRAAATAFVDRTRTPPCHSERNEVESRNPVAEA
ncbi:MAG: 3-methyl-2-oxobutanoate hydroxymethyltransferase [Verrucomicrobia bacterium]|nr:3-methyl-2-oxobutanoate hydroxymethyltransferase [Verrucomicrobiota bacterium]